MGLLDGISCSHRQKGAAHTLTSTWHHSSGNVQESPVSAYLTYHSTPPPPPANTHTHTYRLSPVWCNRISILSIRLLTNTLRSGKYINSGQRTRQNTVAHTPSTNGRLVTCLVSDRVDLCVSFSGHRLLVGLVMKGLVAFVLSCVSVSGRARKLHVTGWNVLGTNVNKCFWKSFSSLDPLRPRI